MIDSTDTGLSRSLEPGDGVILATGATAIAQAAYPEGYTGDVRLMLDGQLMEELAGTLTLISRDQDVHPRSNSVAFDELLESPELGAREPGHRMQD